MQLNGIDTDKLQDRLFVVVALDPKDISTDTYYTVHILDNGKIFVELGGNMNRFLAGTGIYLKKDMTFDMGVTSLWSHIGKFDRFFIGIGTRF